MITRIFFRNVDLSKVKLNTKNRNSKKFIDQKNNNPEYKL